MTKPDPAASPFEVIVVDDISRFPLHAWRYLSRSIVYGIGNVPDSGRSADDEGPTDLRAELTGRTGLRDATGDLVIRWVPLDGRGWTQRLRVRILNSERGRRRFFVDVRGPYVSASSSYRVDDALVLLKNGGVDLEEEVRLVSSYETGSHTFGDLRLAIHSKTAETLEETALSCRGAVPAGAPESPPADPDLHILLTGAGFEVRSITPLVSLGIPSTRKLLGRCLTALHHGVEPAELDNKRMFPLPPGEMASSPLWKAAEAKNLDRYWDLLISRGLSDLSANTSPDGAEDEKVKLDALALELKMREAFRQSFLEHDWGFLNQTLDALSLPWDVWLTTNYTRFVDRSVALLEATTGSREPGDGRDSGKSFWRIVSTSNEAASLLKEVLHGEDPARPNRRLLFKLHGDLGHVSTMAIARHDKDVSSPFAVPIDSLHWVYVAFEQYVTRLIECRVRGSKNCRVFWHIVGHSLYDRLLLRKMEQVFDRTDASRHRIVVVDPQAKTIVKKVEGWLRDRAMARTGSRPKQAPIRAEPFAAQDARRWLAFLVREHSRTRAMWRWEHGAARPRD